MYVLLVKIVQDILAPRIISRQNVEPYISVQNQFTPKKNRQNNVDLLNLRSHEERKSESLHTSLGASLKKRSLNLEMVSGSADTVRSREKTIGVAIGLIGARKGQWLWVVKDSDGEQSFANIICVSWWQNIRASQTARLISFSCQISKTSIQPNSIWRFAYSVLGAKHENLLTYQEFCP